LSNDAIIRRLPLVTKRYATKLVCGGAKLARAAAGSRISAVAASAGISLNDLKQNPSTGGAFGAKVL
jgi:hypothetical protein